VFGSLKQLLARMRDLGATRVYAKKLAPNDNSKNQIYLGGDFSVLNLIPHGEIYSDDEEKAGSKRERAKARVKFYWVTGNGKYLAPDANLILYPKYPEVRMSGFLKACEDPPSEILTVRDPGRVLVIGVTADGEVLGYAAKADNAVAREIEAGTWEQLGVFLELPARPDSKASTKQLLLAELKRVYQLHWIMSQKLGKDGIKAPYTARNGGGYTLEAELGITPNGYSEPDFMGWEVKQYGVGDFKNFLPKSAVTLMTPEPTGGVYQEQGVAEFMRRFGYADKSGKANRINFGGVYTCSKDFHADTGLRMILEGYDADSGKIIDLDGGIALVDRAQEVAAHWSFKGMMQHWNRKHAQAAYVPSLFRTPPPEYSYGPRILLCEQTDFLLFLKAFSDGTVYYDPAVKIESVAGKKSKVKRRSQFRTKHGSLTSVYYHNEIVQIEL
jgi:hypothetical protein